MGKFMRNIYYGCLAILMATPNFIAFANNEEGNNESVPILQTLEDTTGFKTDSEDSGEVISLYGPTVYLDTLNIDKKVVKPGDIVNISLKVTGDLTSSSDMSIGYDKPISDGYILTYLSYNEVTQCFEGTIEIDETFESGEYLISALNVHDQFGNPPMTYLPEYQESYLLQGSFTVVGTEDTADYTAPTIHADTLQVSRNQSSVKVSVLIEDDLSGVDYASVMYERPISQLNEWVDLSYNIETNRFEGILDIGDFPEVGEWKMTFIDAEDAQGNQSRVSDGLEQGSIIITEGIREDNIAPTIYTETLLIDKTVAVKGDLVKISIKAEDKESGIKEIYAIWDGSFWTSVWTELEYNEQTQSYEGVLDTSEALFSGVSSIQILATDYWGNDNWCGDLPKTLFIIDKGQSGWLNNDSTWYYVKEDGTLKTGWLKEGNTWYYLKSSGAMATGWEKIGYDWYYFYSSGKMATNTIIGGWQITASGKAYKL